MATPALLPTENVRKPYAGSLKLDFEEIPQGSPANEI
jgi:hypothetical protein